MEAEGLEIQKATDEYNAEADKLAKQISALEVQLDTLHKKKEATNAAVLALSKKVEQAHIDKRNAELEIQRKTELMIRRVENSSLTKMPVPVTTRR